MEERIAYINSIERDLFKRLDRLSINQATEYDRKKIREYEIIYATFNASKSQNIEEGSKELLNHISHNERD